MVVAMKIVDSTLESRFLKSALCHPHHPLTLIDSENDYCIQCRLLKCQSLSTTASFRTMLAWAITFNPLMTCITLDLPRVQVKWAPLANKETPVKWIIQVYLQHNTGTYFFYWLKKLQPELDELVPRNKILKLQIWASLCTFWSFFMLQEILGSNTDFGSTVVAVVSIAGFVMKRRGNFLRMLAQL